MRLTLKSLFCASLLVVGSARLYAEADDADDEDEQDLQVDDTSDAKLDAAHGEQHAPLSDGAPLSIGEKGFSIAPPVGWEVHRDIPNMTLLLQPPEVKGEIYHRNIQVLVMGGAVTFDDLQLERFEDYLVKAFSHLDISVENYRIRNHVMVDLPAHQGSPAQGALFYSEFKMHGRAIMQAHLLVSSASRHYLVTFTDLAEHFEDDHGTPRLGEAWTSMTSIAVDALPPGRFDVPKEIALIFVGLGALLFGYRTWQKRRSDKAYAALVAYDNEAESASGNRELSNNKKMKAKSSKASGYSDLEELDDATSDVDGEGEMTWNVGKGKDKVS